MTQISLRMTFAARWVEVQQTVATFIAAAGTGFHDTEDLLQKTAVIAYEKYGDFDPARGSFLAWAIGIARHQVMHRRRQAGRDRQVFSETLIEQLADAQSHRGRQFSAPGQAVAWCIEQLRGRAKTVLQLRYLEDLKPAEIALRLKSTSGSVRVILNRARKTLRECVERRLRMEQGGR